MMDKKSTSELSALKNKDQNRYWEIKLGRFNFLSGGAGFLSSWCWSLLTLFMVLPLAITAKFYSAKAKQHTNGKPAIKMIPYDYFTDIYPGCVYSPLIKSYELELFKARDFDGPVLEIGIGDGYFSSLLHGVKNKKAAFGADLIYETLKSAARYGSFDRYVISDATEIPLPDNSLGTVIMNNLMHHLPSRADALREALRVLKTGGKLIFTDNSVGWGLFTWEQLVLRRFRLHKIADALLGFKLKLFAQNLLVDEKYYDRNSRELGYRVLQKVDFISRRSMYLSSLFEFLNLKQGQPTRLSMRKWLVFLGLDTRVRRWIAQIIEDCYAREIAHRDNGGYAFHFLVLEKAGKDSRQAAGPAQPLDFVCPRCKTPLRALPHDFSCARCSITYPVVDGIPIFISYRTQLKNLDSYLERKRNMPVNEYIT